MRPPVLIVLHGELSTPGRVAIQLRNRDIPLDVRRPRFGDDLPKTLANHSGVVIFGGPQSANDPDDFISHGTLVAGVIAATTNNAVGVAGVGFDTRLLNVKACTDQGCPLDLVQLAIRWSADHGAKVLPHLKCLGEGSSTSGTNLIVIQIKPLERRVALTHKQDEARRMMSSQW